MENKLTEERIREIIKEELNSFLEKVEQGVLEKINKSLTKVSRKSFRDKVWG